MQEQNLPPGFAERSAAFKREAPNLTLEEMRNHPFWQESIEVCLGIVREEIVAHPVHQQAKEFHAMGFDVDELVVIKDETHGDYVTPASDK